MRPQAIILARAEAILRPLGLSFARYELLTLLSFTQRGTLPMARAVALLQVHPTSVTNAVQRLQKAGPVGGGTSLLRITADGRELAAEATKHLNADLFTQPGLGDDGLRTLFSVIRDLRRAAGDFA